MPVLVERKTDGIGNRTEDSGSRPFYRAGSRRGAGALERGYHCALGFRTLPVAGELTGTAMHTAVRLIPCYIQRSANRR
jgi:hypothetical protein